MDPIIILAGAGTLAVIIVIAGIVMTRSEENLVEERFGRFEDEQEAQSLFNIEGLDDEDDEASSGTDARALLNPLNNALQERKFGKTWRRKLARANIKLTVAEFAAIHIVAAGGALTAGWLFLFPGDPVMSVAAAFIGFFAPRIYVNRVIGKRLVAFEEQLPDTLGLWVNALRSGYSGISLVRDMSQNDVATKYAPPPITFQPIPLFHILHINNR